MFCRVTDSSAFLQTSSNNLLEDVPSALPSYPVSELYWEEEVNSTCSSGSVIQERIVYFHKIKEINLKPIIRNQAIYGNEVGYLGKTINFPQKQNVRIESNHLVNTNHNSFIRILNRQGDNIQNTRNNKETFYIAEKIVQNKVQPKTSCRIETQCISLLSNPHKLTNTLTMRYIDRGIALPENKNK